MIYYIKHNFSYVQKQYSVIYNNTLANNNMSVYRKIRKSASLNRIIHQLNVLKRKNIDTFKQCGKQAISVT